MIKNVISVIDGAAGSCGKAKVVGEIATDTSINLGAAVTNCMPNAGHTFVDDDNNKTIFRNIPVSCVNPNTELFIGPGSAIDMVVFMDEYKRVKPLLNGRKIYVHEMVPLIEKRHKLYEKEHVKTGSTFKGCGAVTAEKVVRNQRLAFFSTFDDATICSNDEWQERLYKHLDNPDEYVILEGAQGCDLDLNHSGNYPYVTSRNVSTSQLLADSGISPERLLQTIMVIRPFPIRISNITKSGDIIYTGDYGKGSELTWTQINLASQYGGYPYVGDIEQLYDYILSKKLIKKGLKYCPEEYLKQIFGQDFQNVNPNDVSILQALEMERLYWKSKGVNSYISRYLKNMPFTDSDLEPGTIFDQSEQTTVTKKERRVFDLDIDKLKTNCRINTPSSLYLNFFQHLDYNSYHMVGNYIGKDIYFEQHIEEYLHWIESETGVDISTLGTGAKNSERIKLKELIRR